MPRWSDSSNQLDVEVAHLERAPPGLAHDGEGINEEPVERFALGSSLTKGSGLVTQLLIGERTDLGLAGADLSDDRLQALEHALILCSEDFGKKGIEHHVGSNNRNGVEYRRSDAPSHGPGWRTLARGGIVRDTVSAGIPRF